jgi:uncharacterized membrane protein
MKKAKSTTSKKKAQPVNRLQSKNGYGLFLVGSGLVGLIASFSLALERLAGLADPDRVALCDINPILSCGSVMESAQASLFGIPHSFLGIAVFSALITIGVVLLAGAKFAEWFWQLLLAGSLVGFLSVQYLVYQSLFVLNTLCPWCMVIWVAVLPLLFITAGYVTKNKLITFSNAYLGKAVGFIGKHGFTIVALWFIAVIYMIVVQFWYYWSTVIPLL